MRIFVLTLSIASALLTTSHALAVGCDGILSLTRDISVEQQSISIANSLYKSQCQGSSLKKGWNANADVETVIKMVPLKLKLGGGATKEKVEHLCSQFDQWNTENSTSNSIAISTSVPAITAWQRCVELQDEGVFFTVSPVRERVSLSVRRGRDIVKFYGMNYLDENLACSGPFGEGGKNIKVSNNLDFRLEEGTEYPIVCDRKKKKDDGGSEYYPAETFSIQAQGKQPLLERFHVTRTHILH